MCLRAIPSANTNVKFCKHKVAFWYYRSYECELVYNIHGSYQWSALVFLLLKILVLLAEI